MEAEDNDSSVWTDLCTLIPYLRQSLSCTVCGELLIEPYTPLTTSCQHHVCKLCKGGKKRIKPACPWCKSYDRYTENVQLRILLQCYKKLCEYIMSCSLTLSNLSKAVSQIDSNNMNGNNATSSLLDIIREGSGFKDNFKSMIGLSKSAYSILPCVYTNSSTQTSQHSQSSNDSSLQRTTINNSSVKPNTIRTLNSSSHIYSTMNSSRITKPVVKRKSVKKDFSLQDYSVNIADPLATTSPASINLAPKSKATVKPPRSGCRCGNATASPGKLTCCGQRCPCYIESKACLECKCRGCRNPHISDGQKKLPDLHNYPVHIADLHLNVSDQSSIIPSNATVQVVGVYTTQLETLPGRLVIGSDGCYTDGSNPIPFRQPWNQWWFLTANHRQEVPVSETTEKVVSRGSDCGRSIDAVNTHL